MQSISRRNFIAALSVTGFPAAPQVVRESGRARLSKLEIFEVKVNRRGNWLLVRAGTDIGLTGVADASHGGNNLTVRKLLTDFFERLKGRSVWELEAFRQDVLPAIATGGRNAVVAYSALEQCLWDIRGKLLGVPVYELLGGRIRDRIRNYANINRSTEDRSPEGFARMADKAVAAGFDAVKLAPFDDTPRGLTEPSQIRHYIEMGIRCAAAVRSVIGPNRDLLIDVHGRFDLQYGLELAKQIAPLNLYWLEETTPKTEELMAIRRAVNIPTAGGESLFGVKGFYPYIAGGAVDIVMPDVKYCGGVFELKKIAAMAEGAGLGVSPHGPASPIGNAVAAHISATLPNFEILEFSFGEVPWRAELINPPEELHAGFLIPSSRPGFGIELNEKAVERYRA